MSFQSFYDDCFAGGVGLNTSIAWDQVNIQGPVYFGFSVKVEPGATIIGPAWIGHTIYRGNEASELRWGDARG